ADLCHLFGAGGGERRLHLRLPRREPAIFAAAAWTAMGWGIRIRAVSAGAGSRRDGAEAAPHRHGRLVLRRTAPRAVGPRRTQRPRWTPPSSCRWRCLPSPLRSRRGRTTSCCWRPARISAFSEPCRTSPASFLVLES